MCAQDGGRAFRGQWSEARGRHGLRFAYARHDDAEVLGLSEDRNGQAEGCPGDVRQGSKAAIIQLLLSAGMVELDGLHQQGVVEISDGRIIERDMSVFSDA